MLVELSRVELELIEEALDIMAISEAASAEDGPINADDPVAMVLEDAKEQGQRLRQLRELTIRFQAYLLGLHDL